MKKPFFDPIAVVLCVLLLLAMYSCVDTDHYYKHPPAYIPH